MIFNELNETKSNRNSDITVENKTFLTIYISKKKNRYIRVRNFFRDSSRFSYDIIIQPHVHPFLPRAFMRCTILYTYIINSGRSREDPLKVS